MTSHSDLQGIDALWIAADRLGNVAAFTTGGEGPVPQSALRWIEALEDLIDSLPTASGTELIREMPRPDDFINYTRRGLFAYDWSDVHRTTAGAIQGYELQAKPTEPVALSDLPAELRAIAASTEIPGLVFGASMVPRSSIGA